MKTFIPQELIDDLTFTRDDKDRTKFLSLVRGAKEAGYTYAEIAEPLNVSRSAANQWYQQAVKDEVAPTPTDPRPAPAKDPKGTPRKIKPDVPPEEREHLRLTAETARRNTRWSREDSPERQAVHHLEELIRTHIVQRKVPVAAFARHAGVTRRAIMQRLERLTAQGEDS